MWMNCIYQNLMNICILPVKFEVLCTGNGLIDQGGHSLGEVWLKILQPTFLMANWKRSQMPLFGDSVSVSVLHFERGDDCCRRNGGEFDRSRIKVIVTRQRLCVIRLGHLRIKGEHQRWCMESYLSGIKVWENTEGVAYSVFD